jgi:uncharacterized protein
MKSIILKFSVIALFFVSLFSCQSKTSSNISEITGEEYAYDSIKAAEYGADEYGMKKYVMAFLKSGPNQGLTKEEKISLQKAHLENIVKMAEEGKLVLAGPFFGGGEIRGIYIFDVQSLEEAEILTRSDPAIKAGSLAMELKEWYGTAALKDLNKIHKSLEKRSITE